jgi:hypothetical protein
MIEGKTHNATREAQTGVRFMDITFLLKDYCSHAGSFGGVATWNGV